MNSPIGHHVSQPGTEATCPVCRASAPKGRPPGRDRLFATTQETFPLFDCRSCGCVFQHPMPAREFLASCYPEEYWWSGEEAVQGWGARLFRRLEKAYREFVIEDHARFLDACARRHPQRGRLLLDIGCGNGTFLRAARLHGFIPHGMDVSVRAVEIAAKLSGCTVRQGGIGSEIWDEGRFNFITMFHVLEHFPDPRQALRYARQLLLPGGVLIIQVPNVASVQARIFAGRWYGLDPPRHLINFTPKALALLLRETGFDFQVTARFSLRDNPASIASSLVPWLDPVHRKGMRLDSSPVLGGLMEAAYLGLLFMALPPALLESACGAGGTLWGCAVEKRFRNASRH